jgi:hypothetical protein
MDFLATTSNLKSAGRYERKFKQRQLFFAVTPLDRAVVEFTAPRGACDMMIDVVKTLDPRKDHEG